MDLNVYNIHFILGVFGLPNKVTYIANIERGIDTSGILTLEYDTFKCAAIAAKDCKAPVSVNIQGDKGYIHSDFPANVYGEFICVSNNGEEKKYKLNEEKNHLTYELEMFGDLVRKNDLVLARKLNQHTLNVMNVLDEARRQVGIKIV